MLREGGRGSGRCRQRPAAGGTHRRRGRARGDPRRRRRTDGPQFHRADGRRSRLPARPADRRPVHDQYGAVSVARRRRRRSQARRRRGPCLRRTRASTEQVIEKVRTLPGIVSAAAVKDPPFRGNGERNGFSDSGPARARRAGRAERHHDSRERRLLQDHRRAHRRRPRVHAAGSIRRAVRDRRQRSVRAAVLSRRAGGRAAHAARPAPVEIVGVVNDIRQVAMAEPARPTMYLHNLQNSRVKTTIVARTQGDPLAMAGAIRDAVWSIDPAAADHGHFHVRRVRQPRAGAPAARDRAARSRSAAWDSCSARSGSTACCRSSSSSGAARSASGSRLARGRATSRRIRPAGPGAHVGRTRPRSRRARGCSSQFLTAVLYGVAPDRSG